MFNRDLFSYCIIAVLIVALSFTSYIALKNKEYLILKRIENNNGPYDVNFSVQVNVSVDEKLKDIDPNIIKAARGAVYSLYAYDARYYHYNNAVILYINIFDVQKRGENYWIVKFRSKNSKKEEFDKRFYSTCDVTKNGLGGYEGSIVGSRPAERGQTY